MTKRHILNGIVLLGLLAIVLLRRSASPTPLEPQDTVYAMFNSARAGQVQSYLAAFTNPLAATLRQSLAETTEAAFAQSLRDSNATVKGIAVSEPQQSGDALSVRVEYVYQDRSDIQIMRLVNTPAGWKIAATEGDQRITVPVPYGTPVR